MASKKLVLVGMSGGIDSSVAAGILVKKGFDVIGVTLNLYSRQTAGDREFYRELEGAEAVAKKLGIEHRVLDLRDEFREKVLDPFSKAYLSGKTPNPCVICNKTIKFATLLQISDEIGGDFIATGHYARVEKDSNGRILLKKAVDSLKDQTYFLYRLNQDELHRTIFPLGEISRQDVVEMAKLLGLEPTKTRSSQDICFIPDRDYARFLREELGVEGKEGLIVDTVGKVLGKHRGIYNYTIGQRKKIGIGGGPYYVVQIDQRANRIVVGKAEDVYHKRFSCVEPSFVDGKFISGPLKAKVKIRYQHSPDWATIYPCEDERLIVVFDEPQRAITPGQAAVFYTEDGTVLGGATIDTVLE